MSKAIDREKDTDATSEAERWNGHGSAMKPAWEPIILCRAPRGKHRYVDLALKYGTGALWIDGCRITAGPDHEANCLRSGVSGIWTEHTGEGIEAKAHPSGRWPANLLLMHLPECEWVGERQVGNGEVHINKADEYHDGTHDGYKRPNKSKYTHKLAGQIRNYGTETVADWRCAEGCPVAMLDEQSGIGNSSKRQGRRSGKCAVASGAFAGQENVVMGHNDTGGASRFFYTAKAQRHCALCHLPLNRKHGIMSVSRKRQSEGIPCNNVNFVRATSKPIEGANDSVGGHVRPNGPHGNEGKRAKKSIPASSAVKDSLTIPAMIALIVRENVLQKLVEKSVQSAKSAANLCDSCAIAIVQSLVAIKREPNQALHPYLGFMPERNAQTLTQSLALFAEGQANIDTILTTTSLKILFGFVRPIIEDFTKKAYRNQGGGLGPARFQYVSKASRRERSAGLPEGMTNKHPTVKPLKITEYLARLVLPPELDEVRRILIPFSGSGSEMIGGLLAGWDEAVGIELDGDAIEVAEHRLRHWAAKPIQVQLT